MNNELIIPDHKTHTEIDVAEAVEKEMTLSRKQNYHSTGIKNYCKCPKSFTLSREHRIELSSDAITKGLLFEGYLLGFKPEYPEFNIRGMGFNANGSVAKGKGKKDAFCLPLNDRAKYFKGFFEEGEPFVKLAYNGNYLDANELRGEADFIGNVKIDTRILDNVLPDEQKYFFDKEPTSYVTRRVICDIKDTSDIYWIWKVEKQMQVLQSFLYPYMWWKQTGEILDFVYFVSWNKTETIFKQLYFKTTEDTFNLAEKTINMIDSDLFKRPNCSYQNCMKGDYNKICDYIEWCEEGRQMVADSEIISHDELKPLETRITDDMIDEVFKELK